MNPLSLVRFNALAGYARRPQAALFADEVSWFEQGGERVLGVVLRDRIDDDYTGMVMARDRHGRFRAVGFTQDSLPTARHARALLRQKLEQLAMAPDEEYYQGDEKGTPLDFFTPRVKESALHSRFSSLAQLEAYSPARGIIESMMHWYKDPDGNFIEQFQTTGFDARLWELYLFAMFTEIGYAMDRIHASPDFVCQGPAGEFAVEGMTVNPTQDAKGAPLDPPPRTTPEEVEAFVRGFMPVKFGSTLTSKLGKKYWERPGAEDKALVFAIQDFAAPASMIHTRTALMEYLYGYTHEWWHDEAGHLTVRPKAIERHRWAGKEIPSGFFSLDGAENVSAVVFNSSATISKFTRMGYMAGFGSKRVVILRAGTAYNPDPDAATPLRFASIVGEAGYTETWVEGVDVFHNPSARRPVHPAMFPGAAHHRTDKNGLLRSITPERHPLGSVTHILVGASEEEARAALARIAAAGRDEAAS